MPSVTFLVALDIPDVTADALLNEAADVEEDLLSAGHNVLSVVPWARPTLPTAQPAGGFTPLGGTPPPDAPIA